MKPTLFFLSLILMAGLLNSGCQNSESSPKRVIDQTTPDGALQLVFETVQKEKYEALASFCDPKGENDKDTRKICESGLTEEGRVEVFRYFARAKVNGEPEIKEDRAKVPFLYGPDGETEEEMYLVQRDGKWYLLKF